jgi:hypothetical protein
MLEANSHLRDKAILSLEESINDYYGTCIRLKEEEIVKYKYKGYTNGWSIEIGVSGYRFACHVLINNSFPFSSPRFFIKDYKSLLYKVPHIDIDGLLCLGDCGYNYFYGMRSIKPLHSAAYKLLDQGLSGQLNHDFQQEFLNYWSMEASYTAFSCIKKVCTKVLKISYCIIHGKVYFFDSENMGREWLRKRFLSQSDKFIAEAAKFYPTLCLSIPSIWLPTEYPRSGKDILSLATIHGPEAVISLLECTPCSGEDYLPVLFSFQTGPTVTFAATRINELVTSHGPHRMVRSRKSRRKARNTSQVKEVGLLFFSPAAKLSNIFVQRIDADWLYYRGEAGQSGRNRQLREVKVAIFGCGSLGAQVADTLCKAGVGTMALFDPETLSWDNVYRHLLGTDSIGMNKAAALGTFLKQKFPEIHIINFDLHWEQHYKNDTHPKLNKFDLILSLIGDNENKTEQFLSLCTHHEHLFPPVIFGWTEVWGAAGHALLLGHQANDGCLMCSDNGEEQLRNVFIFDSEQFISLPECSTVFAPYGFIDTLPVVSMISELALDFFFNAEIFNNYRIWVANLNKISKYGGKINQWAQDKFGYIGGEQVIRTNWVADENCKVCHADKIQRM